MSRLFPLPVPTAQLLGCAVGAFWALFPAPALTAGKQGLADVPARTAHRMPETVTIYKESLAAARLANPPVLKLSAPLTNDAQEAQALALRDPRFTAHARDAQGRAYRVEVLGVYPLRESDAVASAQFAVCMQNARCHRVDAYNFGTGDGYSAVVNVSARSVLGVNRMVGIAPEISARLERAAIELARTSPLVEKALGRVPAAQDFVMGTTRTSLARSHCERSAHLCVAPTIVAGNSALFVIVDLTDFRVAGVRWNKLGRSTTAPTEKRVQNEAIARQYCERATKIERNGWTFDFQITSSDGVRVGDIAYRGDPWIKSVKTVDWHVRYSWKDRYGYSDAVGCPMFSQAAVVAIDPPEFVDLVEGGKSVGFSLIQDFRSDQWPRPCNYYYRQRFDFFDDGRFRPVSASFGRGCGDDATYRPVTRVEFVGNARVAQWSGTTWQAWSREQWKLAESIPASPVGAKLAMQHPAQRTEVIPNTTALEFSRGDNAWLFVTAHPAGRDEGASDLPAIGNCCNQDHRQGPEKFMNPPEALDGNTPVVLWYVAQLSNDSRPGNEYCWADYELIDGVPTPKAFPCYSGVLLQRRPTAK